MDDSNRLLLIVACSQRKRSDPGLLPAIERYDGGSFRVLRKAKREGYLSQNIDVLILSAKYGLIAANTLIPDYEQRMNRNRAVELKSQVIQTLKHCANQVDYTEVYLELGQAYYLAMEDIQQIFNLCNVIVAKGRIGERLCNLKSWLHHKGSKISYPL